MVVSFSVLRAIILYLETAPIQNGIIIADDVIFAEDEIHFANKIGVEVSGRRGFVRALFNATQLSSLTSPGVILSFETYSPILHM